MANEKFVEELRAFLVEKADDGQVAIAISEDKDDPHVNFDFKVGGALVTLCSSWFPEFDDGEDDDE
jgi:hypothetical protein